MRPKVREAQEGGFRNMRILWFWIEGIGIEIIEGNASKK